MSEETGKPIENTAQEEALSKAIDLLSEHFDGFLLVTLVEVWDGKNNRDEIDYSWKGGAVQALGLAMKAQKRFEI